MRDAPSWVRIATVVVVAVAGYAPAAAALSTRTWVAAGGSDDNPCSTVAPCKTFAGAILKTAPGGEIDCLGPGGFGPVIITRALTIDCRSSTGAILAGGTVGVVVNAGPDDVVRLRGLSIDGLRTGTNGVRFLSGAQLSIEDSVVQNFAATNANGVEFAATTPATLLVSRSTISNNGAGATGGGVRVTASNATLSLVLSDVTLTGNANAAVVMTANGTAGITAAVHDGVISFNDGGVAASSNTGEAISVFLDGVLLASNKNVAVGVSGSSVVGRVTKSSIVHNGTGVLIAGGAQLRSYGDNRLIGNGSDGAFTAPVLPPN